MFKTRFVVVLLALGSVSSGLRADTQKFFFNTVPSTIDSLEGDDGAFFKPNSADLINGAQAKNLLIAAIGKTCTHDGKPCLRLKGDTILDYAIIHAVYWSKPDKDGKQTPSQNWYVFRDQQLEAWSYEDFTSRNRIFGQTSVVFLYIQINKATDDLFRPAYDVQVKSKLPSNVLNLFSVLGSLSSLHGQAAPPGAPPAAPPAFRNYWAASRMDDIYKTADIVFTPAIVGYESAGAKTFDNEGKAHWDISFGVPLRKISEAKFDTSTSTISPNNVDTHNILALADFYIRARDLKTSNFQWTPSVVTGVAFAQQPLHKILVGAGWGPAFAQFYVGAMFVKEAATPSASSPASLRESFSPEFAFGLNLPVRALQDKLTSK